MRAFIGLVGAAALLSGCASGDPAATVTVTEPGPTVTATVTTAEPLPEPGTASSFGPGMYVVGLDIEPGRYRSVEAATDSGALPCRVVVRDGDDYVATEQIVTGRLVIDVPDIEGAIVEVGSFCDFPIAPLED